MKKVKMLIDYPPYGYKNEMVIVSDVNAEYLIKNKWARLIEDLGKYEKGFWKKSGRKYYRKKRKQMWINYLEATK